MSKKGRPRKEPNLNLEQVEALGQYGLTQEAIAHVMGVSKPTLYRWKKDPAFLYAIKRGWSRRTPRSSRPST